MAQLLVQSGANIEAQDKVREVEAFHLNRLIMFNFHGSGRFATTIVLYLNVNRINCDGIAKEIDVETEVSMINDCVSTTTTGGKDSYRPSASRYGAST